VGEAVVVGVTVTVGVTVVVGVTVAVGVTVVWPFDVVGVGVTVTVVVGVTVTVGLTVVVGEGVVHTVGGGEDDPFVTVSVSATGAGLVTSEQEISASVVPLADTATPKSDGMSILTVPALVNFSEPDMVNEVAVKSVTVLDMCSLPDCAPVTGRSALTTACVNPDPGAPLIREAMSGELSVMVTEWPVFLVPEELKVMATGPALVNVGAPVTVAVQW
jgi:hypothetical protein